MSKVRIFIKSEDILDTLQVRNKEVIHKVRDVLRLSKNNSLFVFDGEGKEYDYQITDLGKNSLSLRKRSLSADQKKPGQQIILGFPIIKEEKANFIIQKATELGVSGLIPFICERSLKKTPSLKKMQRWKRIALEAVRQSQRLWKPEVLGAVSFSKLIKGSYDLKLVASIQGRSFRESIKTDYKKILLVIGPEGGFSDLEYENLRSAGFDCFKLSANVLRSETAAITAVGLIKYYIDNDI